MTYIEPQSVPGASGLVRPEVLVAGPSDDTPKRPGRPGGGFAAKRHNRGTPAWRAKVRQAREELVAAFMRGDDIMPYTRELETYLKEL